MEVLTQDGSFLSLAVRVAPESLLGLQRPLLSWPHSAHGSSGRCCVCSLHRLVSFLEAKAESLHRGARHYAGVSGSLGLPCAVRWPMCLVWGVLPLAAWLGFSPGRPESFTSRFPRDFAENSVSCTVSVF